MEIFKKLGLILILVLEIIAFLKCIKKPKKTSKENLIENEKEDLETKDLSIYELIKTSIQPNGELPEDFKLPPKDPNGVPWADGAIDGVSIYHLVENEEDFYYELTAKDLRKLAIAEKQSQLGMFTDSSEVHRKAQQMINQWK